MITYRFTLVLAELVDSEADADRLYARFNDGTLITTNGVTWIEFDREAANLSEAIDSAVEEIENVPFHQVAYLIHRETGMTAAILSRAELDAAEAAWEKYLAQHPVAGHEGEMAGIDPKSGDVIVGRSIPEIVERRRVQGITAPLLFKRIGYPTVYRKGHRQ